MLHLVGMTRKTDQWQRLLSCISAGDTVVTYPEAAALHDKLAAALPAGAAGVRLGVELDEPALARRVAAETTITWFDDD